MLLKGLWLLCDDSVVRPVIHGEVVARDGTRVQTPFLVDPAADRTVLSADIFQALGLTPVGGSCDLGGVGGVVSSVLIQTQIEFPREEPGPVIFRGQFAAFTTLEALDMSVLGRDILNLFAVIIDKPGDTVCLLGQQHYYTIGKQ
jgi:hypothetical protein